MVTPPGAHLLAVRHRLAEDIQCHIRSGSGLSERFAGALDLLALVIQKRAGNKSPVSSLLGDAAQECDEGVVTLLMVLRLLLLRPRTRTEDILDIIRAEQGI